MGQITWFSKRWARLPGFAKFWARLPGEKIAKCWKKWTRLPGGPDYLVRGPNWTRLPGRGQKGGADYLECFFVFFSAARARTCSRRPGDAADIVGVGRADWRASGATKLPSRRREPATLGSAEGGAHRTLLTPAAVPTNPSRPPECTRSGTAAPTSRAGRRSCGPRPPAPPSRHLATLHQPSISSWPPARPCLSSARRRSHGGRA